MTISCSQSHIHTLNPITFTCTHNLIFSLREIVETYKLVCYGNTDKDVKIISMLIQNFQIRIEFKVVICFFIYNFDYDFEIWIKILNYSIQTYYFSGFLKNVWLQDKNKKITYLGTCVLPTVMWSECRH